jgi:hypothetical protein
MAKIDDNKAFELISHYYDSETSKVSTLSTFLALLEDEIEDEKHLARVTITPKELASEATYALLEAFHEVNELGHAIGWKGHFLKRLRSGLKPFRLKQRRFIDIGEIALEDQNPNPEEIYIQKELIHLVKLYIHNHFDLVACDWFVRRFANGERAEDIANDYGVSTRSVNKRLVQMLPRVKRHMEKLNGN